MDVELIPASRAHKRVIKNLMQFYYYDFSEYVQCDVGAKGLYSPYPHLDDYWKEGKNTFPYVVMKEGCYAGFVLVKSVTTEAGSYFSIAEFFILKKYRRQGMGTAVAALVFNIHKGQWEVYQKESNKPAQLFWNKVINACTQGQFTERVANGKRIQNFAIRNEGACQ